MFATRVYEFSSTRKAEKEAKEKEETHLDDVKDRMTFGMQLLVELKAKAESLHLPGVYTKQEIRKLFLKIFPNLLFVARQGLALHTISVSRSYDNQLTTTLESLRSGASFDCSGRLY